ncbi:MAG: Helix-turn-helix domain protein [Bacteroidetes bacterium ADurb.BinA174]|nr:MAG: Helix-turn-helix domain protein [Bacteroidetes bacterium ADurb.BinA174]
MLIDKQEFRAYMDRLIERFDLMDEKMDRLIKKKTCLDGEDLLDNQDMLQLLKISHRTLQRFRSSGELPYFKMNGKIYYKLSDVNRFIREVFEGDTVRCAKQRQIEPRKAKKQ